MTNWDHGAYSATYRYEQVKLTGQKSVVCSGGCGKKVRRQKTFSQTINPFNKNDHGKPASRTEIMVKLRQKIKEWKTEGVTCTSCANSES